MGFQRGGRERDPYVVDLGIFHEDGPNKLQADGTRNPLKDPQRSSSGSHPSSNPSGKQGIERRMLMRNKSHIKHTFRELDEKGQNLCKFVCTTYWATQFHAVREAFLSPGSGSKDSSCDSSFGSPLALDIERSYILSLSSAYSWAASGGKSGASFARTLDDRFVIKCISRTELQMFLDCAPAYFEYLSKAFFHGLPTVLCKVIGVYQIGCHNRVTGKRTMEQVAVMQNIFYGKKVTKVFDLKGSLRGRFAKNLKTNYPDNSDNGANESSCDEAEETRRKKKAQKQNNRSNNSDLDAASDASSHNSSEDEDLLQSESKDSRKMTSNGNDGSNNSEVEPSLTTLLDGDFLEYTMGRPLPLSDKAKALFHMSILNDTLFLSIINVLDYSILVGIDEDSMEFVGGIIDFMRQ